MKKWKKASSDKKLGKVLLLTVLFFIVLVSIVFYLFFSKGVSNSNDPYQQVLEGKETDTSYSYNNFVFVKQDDLWYTKLQSKNTVYSVPFHFGPKDVEDIPIYGDAMAFGRSVVNEFNRSVYVAFDPIGIELKYVAIANGEFSFNVIQTLGITPIISCTKNSTEACHSVPIVSCSSQGMPVIYLKQEAPAQISVNGTCLTVQGTGDDLVKATDRLLMTWYSIIK